MLFSLWGIASMAVNPVLLQVAGIIINVAFTLPQPICCWNTGVERFMGRDARKENFALEGAAEESKVFGRLSPPEWDHGTAPEQPLGAAAVSADRTRPRVAPSTNTAFYWLYHKGTQMQTYTGTHLPAISKTQISGCVWIPQKLFFFSSSSQCYTQSFWALFDSRLVFLLGYCIIIIITEEDISFCSLWIKGKQSVSIFSEWQQRHLCPALQVKQRPRTQNLICPNRTRKVLDSMRDRAWWLTFEWTADSRGNWTDLSLSP